MACTNDLRLWLFAQDYSRACSGARRREHRFTISAPSRTDRLSRCNEHCSEGTLCQAPIRRNRPMGRTEPTCKGPCPHCTPGHAPSADFRVRFGTCENPRCRLSSPALNLRLCRHVCQLSISKWVRVEIGAIWSREAPTGISASEPGFLPIPQQGDSAHL